MGVLRQWKRATSRWEQAQSGQNQHQKKHKKIYIFYVWMKRIPVFHHLNTVFASCFDEQGWFSSRVNLFFFLADSFVNCFQMNLFCLCLLFTLILLSGWMMCVFNVILFIACVSVMENMSTLWCFVCCMLCRLDCVNKTDFDLKTGLFKLENNSKADLVLSWMCKHAVW